MNFFHFVLQTSSSCIYCGSKLVLSRGAKKRGEPSVQLLLFCRMIKANCQFSLLGPRCQSQRSQKLKFNETFGQIRRVHSKSNCPKLFIVDAITLPQVTGCKMRCCEVINGAEKLVLLCNSLQLPIFFWTTLKKINLKDFF